MFDGKILLKNIILATCCALYALIGHATPKNFASDPQVIQFASEMADRHQFDAAKLLHSFAKIHPNPAVLKWIRPPASPAQRSWSRYRARFLDEIRIQEGLRFWKTHGETLARASHEYGVPEEIIVAIIGIETLYGRNQGSFSVFEALSTLAFHYPPRASFFREELEQFLLLARENQLDPLTIKGSFAGAIGIPQFMPGSLRRYAVDFDGDGRIDLARNTADVIGSVARFLERHGWQANQAVAFPATLEGEPRREWIDAGIRPTLKTATLVENGVQTQAPPDSTVTLIDLVTPRQATEFWLGLDNFYVITRYNRSSFYAMSVFQLADEIRQRRKSQ